MRAATTRAAALGLVLVVALGAVAASTPAERALTLGYTMQWGSPAGMFAWLAGGLGVAGLLGEARRRDLLRAPARFSPGPRAAAFGLALTAAVGVWSGAAHWSDGQRWIYGPAKAAVDAVEAELPPGRSVFVEPSTGEVGHQAYPLVVYALRRNGDRPLVVTSAVETMGSWYGVAGRRYDSSVALVEGDADLPDGGRVVARIPLPGAPPTVRNRMLTVVLTERAAAPVP
jgi:hypothetical protein